MRTLVIIIVLALIVMIAKRLWQTPRPRPPARHNRQTGQMVQCANCGIYIPEQDALRRGDHFYCSQAHLDEDMSSKS
jgi:uncharacterized protein